MRALLVGSDCEENLGIGMVAAALLKAGHRVRVVPFDDAADAEAVVHCVLKTDPDLVGLALQFQHGSQRFVRLADRLREAGYRGHLTCGGQYPTMAWAELLDHHPGLDSVVLHEGEATIVELARALQRRQDLARVPGLALRSGEGKPVRTAPRPLCPDLDELPFAHRYRAPTRHLGVPFLPITGSRGCWGSCAFCGISTYYREARTHGGGGRKLRFRSPRNIAAEMAMLWHAEGGPCLFCFHDDTLLLPRPADSLARLTELRRALDELGVGDVGLIGKCRPDCVTPELARELARLGVVRLFVGVENGSQRGLDHLGRRTSVADLERAFSALDEAGIFICYNLLLFEPDCVLDDVRENIAFIRRHATTPINFCRAEAYHGTPLNERVRARGTLLGNYLGWDYRIHDDRAELLFRILSGAFRERNYDPAGVANRNMGFGYLIQVLRRFYDVSSLHARQLLEEADALVRDISLDTADLLERATDLVERADLGDHDRITRLAARFGLQVAAHDRVWHNRLDDVIDQMEAFAEQGRRRPAVSLPDKARVALGRVALASCLATTVQACGGETESSHAAGVAGQAGASRGGSTVGGYILTDGAPPTGGQATGGVAWGGYVADPGGTPPYGGRATGGWAVDMGGSPPIGGRSTGGIITGDGGGSPPIGGRTSGGRATGGMADMGGAPPMGGRATGGYHVSDGGGVPPIGGRSTGGYIITGDGGAPPTGGRTMGGWVVDPPPAPSPGVVEHWRDTAPLGLTRSEDLPLFDPPKIRLMSRVLGEAVHVTVEEGEPSMTIRWESEGKVVGEGRKIIWYPASPDDALRMVARTRGGLVFTSLRARTVLGLSEPRPVH